MELDKAKQMTDHVTNNMLAHATNSISFDYQDSKKEFGEFIVDYVEPALDKAKEDYLYRKTKQYQHKEAQDKLNTIVDSLKEWCKERHLTKEQQDKHLISNVLEELTELSRAKDDNERVDALCDICIYTMNALGTRFTYGNYIGYNIREENELHKFITIANDEVRYNRHVSLILLCFGIITHLGYDPFKAMNETIREIQSRSGKWNKKLGKFVKDDGVYNNKQSLVEFEKNIRATYPDDNVVFEYRDNEVDVEIDYGKEIYTYKLWYKADYDKCKLDNK